MVMRCLTCHVDLNERQAASHFLLPHPHIAIAKAR